MTSMITARVDSEKRMCAEKVFDEVGLTTFREMPIISAHAAATESLPEIHGDPFDRLLIAQAQGESVTLVTHDGKLASYGQGVVSV